MSEPKYEIEGKLKKMKKLNVAVFFGGCSSEYGVSLSSASAVISNLDRERYEPVLIGITSAGVWYHYTGPVERLADDSWALSDCCVPAVLSPNRGERLLLLLKPEGVTSISIDIALPILHGRNGEDGTLQGLLELAGIPLAGCGTLASALCMDKDRAHKLASLSGIRVPKSLVLKRPRLSDIDAPDQKRLSGVDIPAEAEVFARNTGYPLFVKPVKAGSSYGVTKVASPEQLSPAISLAYEYDDQVILEENIEGFEVGCAILGTDELLVGEVDEIELSGGFFDFTEKYTLKTSAIHVPARIAPTKAEEIKTAAKTVYRALGCSGFARVDLFLTPEGEIVFNEVNTIPGFTEHSRYPGMMKAAGYTFRDILNRILEQS